MTARTGWVQTEPFLAAPARPIATFAFALPIAVLGGLIGLGGAGLGVALIWSIFRGAH